MTYNDGAVNTISKIIREEAEAFEARVCDRIGQALSLAPTSAPTQTTDIDVAGITFKVKGGAEAGPNDKWGWAWARAQDGSYHDESRALVQYLEQYGELNQGGFRYSLSNDGKFLNRKKV
ncbi:hypothetical protein MCGE09_00027 [Thaumarchaeota archaeon SCGC AB-539-E09]|nr:hypothetical protein MCGE09_00027 [Thaumarchaeota archaeon SCGC AB-539-E09]